MKKATAAQAKRLGADRYGWGTFKHRLMRHLGIPEGEYHRWDVPTEWQEAFCKVNGQTLNKSRT